MTTDIHAVLDLLETPLLDAELKRVDLPPHLGDLVPDGRDGEIVSRAYEGEAVRLARTTRLALPSFQGVNVVVFPDLDRPAPVFGADLADDGDAVSSFIVDTWSTESVESDVDWGAVHAPFEQMEVDWRRGADLKGPIASLLSDRGLVARSEAGACTLQSALDGLVAAVDEMMDALEGGPRRTDDAIASMQRRFCRMHANKPGGRDMLVAAVGESRADTFLEDVFYPAPASN